MHELLEKIFSTGEFVNKKREPVKIHSETPKHQCEFLQELIRENQCQRSIEIGFAYGLSTLAITEQITKNGGFHLVIDPFEFEHWEGNGLDLIEQAGYLPSLTFVEDFSYKVLPELLKQEKQFDFAYIDSTKVFDFLMVDFFYLDKIMAQDGIIVFDDVNFPGIRKLLRLIAQFPHYEVLSQTPVNPEIPKTQNINAILKKLPRVNAILKQKMKSLINLELLKDAKLGINNHCVALRKIDTDHRNWNWHHEF